MKTPIVIFFTLLGIVPLPAQDVLGIRPPAPPAPGTSGSGASLSSSTGRATTSAQISVGSLSLSPGLDYRLTYADGLQSEPGRRTNSYIERYSPSLAIGIGSDFNAAYTISWTDYSNGSFDDSVDHLFTLSASRTFNDLRIGLSETYNKGSTLRAETGRQTFDETSLTQLAADLRFGNKSSFSLNAAQDLRFIERAPDPYEWSGTGIFRYQISPRWSAGIGSGLGYVSVDPGADTYYYQPQGELTWTPSDKVVVALSGGQEIRKGYRSGAATLRNPYFNGSLRYLPTSTTTIEINSARRISTSYFVNTVNENEIWDVSLEQRLLGRFFLTASYSDTKTDYTATFVTLTAASDVEILDDATALLVSQLGPNDLIPVSSQQLRHDSVKNYEFALRTTLFDRLNLSAAYRYNWNTSTNSNFTYSGKQLTFTAGLNF